MLQELAGHTPRGGNSKNMQHSDVYVMMKKDVKWCDDATILGSHDHDRAKGWCQRVHRMAGEIGEKYALKRGGTRRQRDPLQDPRASVQTWAIQRLEEHAPDLINPTTRLIVKAEIRLAIALMNSRSTIPEDSGSGIQMPPHGDARSSPSRASSVGSTHALASAYLSSSTLQQSVSALAQKLQQVFLTQPVRGEDDYPPTPLGSPRQSQHQ